jgi:hypothetical protein
MAMATVSLVLGWISMGVSAVSAVAMHRARRRMQARAWGLMVLTYAAAVIGVVLLSLGVDALP